MKQTTTVREYDEQGRCTKETITETETAEAAPVTVIPYQPCTCGSFGTWCPMHGYQRYGVSWTSGSITTTGTAQLYYINGGRSDDDGLGGVPAKVS